MSNKYYIVNKELHFRYPKYPRSAVKNINSFETLQNFLKQKRNPQCKFHK